MAGLPDLAQYGFRLSLPELCRRFNTDYHDLLFNYSVAEVYSELQIMSHQNLVSQTYKEILQKKS